MTVRPLILAAGVGKRMRSALPKVLHRICGRPMIHYVVAAVAGAGLDRPVVVVGRGADAVRAEVGDAAIFVEQREQRGTGHAVMVGLEALQDADGPVLVVYGDLPLLKAATLRRLIAHHLDVLPGLTVLTAHVSDPSGYGRIVRDAGGDVARIVEEADASEAERAIREINAGTYLFDAALLREALSHVHPANAQREYYLTDVVAWALSGGARVDALAADDPTEVLGVNSRRDLARAEAAMRARLLDRLMDAGVTILDPPTTYVHADVTVGEDTIIHPGTSLEGATRIGRGCVIGPQARLVDAVIGEGVTITASTIVESSMGEGSRIGPYSHLRPGTRVGRRVEIGNFAEVKNSTIGDDSKVHHKSYLGDATVGQRVNIGAGTITCNLRDRTGKKWPTVIEDEAFIGSDTMLVAPVRVGRGHELAHPALELLVGQLVGVGPESTQVDTAVAEIVRRDLPEAPWRRNHVRHGRRVTSRRGAPQAGRRTRRCGPTGSGSPGWRPAAPWTGRSRRPRAGGWRARSARS
jgi:bifunctional UDP-N-acetylglucosamine pyrophosphorylase/glucosamine-1-phosphate N-acetyltransferase